MFPENGNVESLLEDMVREIRKILFTGHIVCVYLISFNAHERKEDEKDISSSDSWLNMLFIAYQHKINIHLSFPKRFFETDVFSFSFRSNKFDLL